MTNLSLKSFRLRNFKAVRDSKTIRFSPLTAFIGNNGSGKSSIVEGLFTYQMIVRDGLETAMNYWRGFEQIRNQAVAHPPISTNVDRPYERNPIEFHSYGQTYRAEMSVTAAPNGDIFILEETLDLLKQITFTRDSIGRIYAMQNSQETYPEKCLDDESMLDSSAIKEQLRHWNASTLDDILNWQFINLNPSIMGHPQPQQRTAKQSPLNNDASNLSQYLLDIYKLDQDAFNGIVETLQYVLPYARDLQPTLTSRAELEPKIYLQLTEGDFKIPGWLFSTGTLRILALLALLRHPQPAPLIVIEEIENGLDPRTIHLIVEEIRNAVESGRTQVIITTHSPYLLDLLNLSHLVLVERDSKGQPVFSRPANHQSLQEWSKQFNPGQLYTMGQLSSAENP
jgi:predicted ATPase